MVGLWSQAGAAGIVVAFGGGAYNPPLIRFGGGGRTRGACTALVSAFGCNPNNGFVFATAFCGNAGIDFLSSHLLLGAAAFGSGSTAFCLGFGWTGVGAGGRSH